jgi:hypothetical protein
MSHTLTYRSQAPVDPGVEGSIRQAVEAFNRGREWVLAIRRDHDGRLIGTMEPAGGGEARWPGPYEAEGIMEAVRSLSRDFQVDWDVLVTYGRRPVGVVRAAVCHSDQAALDEATRRLGESYDRRVGR